MLQAYYREFSHHPVSINVNILFKHWTFVSANKLTLSISFEKSFVFRIFDVIDATEYHQTTFGKSQHHLVLYPPVPKRILLSGLARISTQQHSISNEKKNRPLICTCFFFPFLLMVSFWSCSQNLFTSFSFLGKCVILSQAGTPQL